MTYKEIKADADQLVAARLREVFAAHGYNETHAARELGIPRRSFQILRERHNVTRPSRAA